MLSILDEIMVTTVERDAARASLDQSEWAENVTPATEEYRAKLRAIVSDCDDLLVALEAEREAMEW